MPIPQLLPAVAKAGLGVTLDGLAFNQGAVDDNGVQYHLRSIEGWDSPSLRVDLDDRPLGHGAYRGTSYYGVREIGLKGVLVSPYGLESLRLAKDRLAYACDLTDTDGVLTVAEAPAKRALVRRAGRLRYAQVGGHLLRWELDLTAADPRKYGTALRSVTLTGGQSGTASNAGQFRAGAPLVLVFTGAGTMQVGAVAVTVSGPATIDTLEGTVMDGSSTVYSRLTSSGPLPTLPPAAGTSVSYSGGGQVTLTWRDTWV